MTTGEIANGRSISALSIALPRNVGAPARARRTPKIVFSGTAIATISDRQVEGVLRLRGGDGVPGRRRAPSSKVAEEDHPDRDQQQQRQVAERDDPQPVACEAVPTSGPWRRPPAAARRPITSRTTSEIDQQQTETAAAPVVLSLSIWPKMKTEATSVSNGSCRRSGPASRTRRSRARRPAPRRRGSPGVRFGQDDPAEDGERARRRARRRPPPSRGRARAAPAAPRGRRTAASRTAARARRRPGCRRVDADRAVGPVEGEQGEAGDDRRQRERQVDHRVDDPLAAELVADQDPGDQRARITR